MISIPDAIRRHHRALLVTAILLLATGLRLWNFDFDPLDRTMPLSHDSYAKFLMAERVAQGHDQPLNYRQPYFLIYTLGALFKGCVRIGKSDPLFLWNLSTLYMILFSVITVGLVVPLTRRVTDHPLAPALAALLAAVIPVSVIGCRYLKEDTPLMMFQVLALLLLVRLLQRPRSWWYLASGLVIGVACSVKYAALNMIPFYLLAHGLAVAGVPRGQRLRQAVSPWFFGGLLLVPLGFLAFDSYVIPRWDRFSEAFMNQAHYAGRGHHDGTAIGGWDYGWVFYLRHAILPGMTIPLAVTALAGVVLVWIRPRRVTAFLATWLIVAYLEIEASHAKPFPFFARYMHSLFPVLCVLAAWTLTRLASAARGAGRWAVIGLVVVCTLTPLAKTAVINAALKSDTRVRGTHWINEHLEPGSIICLDDAYYSPRPDEDTFDVRYTSRMYRYPLERLLKEEFDYVVLNSFRYHRYEIARAFSQTATDIYADYREIIDACEPIHEIRPALGWQTYGFHNPVIWIYRLPHAPAVAPDQ